MSQASRPHRQAPIAQQDPAWGAGAHMTCMSWGASVETEEIAAVLAAVRAYLSAKEERVPPQCVLSRWSRAGRLESRRIPATERSMQRGWSI